MSSRLYHDFYASYVSPALIGELSFIFILFFLALISGCFNDSTEESWGASSGKLWSGKVVLFVVASQITIMLILYYHDYIDGVIIGDSLWMQI